MVSRAKYYCVLTYEVWIHREGSDNRRRPLGIALLDSMRIFELSKTRHVLSNVGHRTSLLLVIYLRCSGSEVWVPG